MFSSSSCRTTSPSRCWPWSVSSSSRRWPSWRPSVSSVFTPVLRKRGETGDRERYRSLAELLLFKIFSKYKEKGCKILKSYFFCWLRIDSFFYTEEALRVVLLNKKYCMAQNIHIKYWNYTIRTRYHPQQPPASYNSLCKCLLDPGCRKQTKCKTTSHIYN